MEASHGLTNPRLPIGNWTPPNNENKKSETDKKVELVTKMEESGASMNGRDKSMENFSIIIYFNYLANGFILFRLLNEVIDNYDFELLMRIEREFLEKYKGKNIHEVFYLFI